MTKPILAALTAIATVLVLTPLAHASPAPTAAGDIPLAEEFWGGPPTQCTLLTIGVVPAAGDGGDATQPAPGEFIPCEMQLTEVGTLVGEGVEVTREMACLIVVHEEGHLHGFGHSPDPNSVMYPVGPLSAAEVPRCVETPRIVSAPQKRPRRRRRFVRGEDL